MNMSKKRVIIPCVVAAVLTIGSLAMYEDQQMNAHVSAAIYEHTLNELTQKAEYAIVGTVKETTSIRVDMPKESDEDRVYTDIIINVEEDLLGNYNGSQISVRILGGETETMIMTTDFAPNFVEGNRVIVLISDISDGYTYKGHHFVIGQKQGVFDLSVSNVATNQYSGDTIQKNELVSKIKHSRGIQ